MRAFLTYDDYTKLGGSLDNSSFNRHLYRATVEINHYTFNRITEPMLEDEEIAEKLKHLAFELVEFHSDSKSYVNSKSAGVVSESYDLSKLINFADDLINEYLCDVFDENGTRLTYAGV